MEQTTISINKKLRDKLMKFKYKFHMSDLNAVVHLLYNIKDETKLNKEVVGIQSNTLALTK